MEELHDWDLDLTVDQILRGQGADPKILRERRPALVEAAEWALAEGLKLIEPRIAANTFSVMGIRHERLLLEGGAWLQGRLVVQHLGGARSVTVMVGTIGPRLEELAGEMLHSDPVRGLALDGFGTAAVESLAVQACGLLGRRAEAQGLITSVPISPGMVGWEVDPGQRQIFELVDGTRIGMRLNHSLMMLPKKSFSQVVGTGENFLQGRTCDFCSLKDTCRYQDHYMPV